jgi:hypothetical protein
LTDPAEFDAWLESDLDRQSPGRPLARRLHEDADLGQHSDCAGYVGLPVSSSFVAEETIAI